MSSRDISITTKSVASQYDRGCPVEKTIEFSSPAGGGLISFTLRDDRLDVHVYRQDMTVAVSAGEPGQPVSSGNLRMDRALYLAAKAYAAAWEARHMIVPNPNAYSCAWCDADIEQAAVEGAWYDVATADAVDSSGTASEAATECDDSPGGTDVPSPGKHIPGGELLVREARGWIADCFGGVDVADLSDRTVVEGVQRHYEGGWAAFVTASAS